MPIESLGLPEADLDAMHLGLQGIAPESSRDDFPALLLQLVQMESIRLDVTEDEIFVEVPGGFVSRYIRRPTRK